VNGFETGSSSVADLLGSPQNHALGRSDMLDVTRHSTAPFDTVLLDRLMDEAGLDVLIATSKHNIQYLLGGHRSFFFDNMDAIGISRYLPAFVYPKGAPDKAAYFGHGMETYQTQLKPF
jgi:Xaa-Pro aminopeptidase